MTTERFSTTPSGEATVDVLIQACTSSSSFTRGDQEMADLVRTRILFVPFAPYWGAKFQDWRDKYNGNPAGFFAQEVFRAAETQEGDQLFQTVADELADKFGEAVLEAETQLPVVTGLELISLELNPLSEHLVRLRREIECSSIPLSPRPRCISDGWITLAHQLMLSDPKKGNQLLEDFTRAYAETDEWTTEWMDAYEGMMGGFSGWDRDHAILTDAVAKPLASYFPSVVVSELTTPSQLYVWNAGRSSHT